MKKGLMKSKYLRRALAFVCVIGIVVSVCVSAEAATAVKKQLDATYNGITITLDGATVEPKDAGGNTVEPFIVDGTTYLPVRALASALGLDVDWNQQTNTVVLKSKDSGAETFDFSLASYIQLKTAEEMTDILDLTEDDVDLAGRNYIVAGKTQFGGYEFEKQVAFSVYANKALDTAKVKTEDMKSYMSGVGYTLTLTDETSDADVLKLVQALYAEMVKNCGGVSALTEYDVGDTHVSYGNTLNDKTMADAVAGGKVPEGSATWRDPSNVDHILTMKVAKNGVSGYIISVSMELDRYIMSDRQAATNS